MPQYQGMWTAQKAAQLQGQQQWVTDPQFDNTVLLLQADNAANGAQNNTFLDSSANAFTITRNGNLSQGSFTPFSATGWSVYNSGGASGGLLITDNVVLRPNTNNFTLEFWINFSSLTSIQSVFSKGGTSSNQLLIRTNSGTGTLLVIVSGTTIITASASSSVGAWDHYALVRSGNNWTLYRNGVSVGTATNSTSISTTANIEIGSSSVFNSMTGYISNLRFTIGAALYTSSFTPSPTPLTTTSQGASATQVELLTCQSNRPLDNSTNNFAVTPTTNTSIQAFSPFAPQYQYTQDVIGGSGYFDGTGDYLTVPDNEALDGFNDFTIEFWLYYNSVSGTQVVLDKGWNSATLAPYLIFGTDGALVAYASGGGGSWNILPGSSFGTLTTGQWYHIAVTRSGTDVRLFRNGQITATATSGITMMDSASPLGIGASPQVGGLPLNGYLSGLRIVKGTAVYTAAFTPPTAPPTAITNTSLLLNYTNAAITNGTMKNILETVGNAQVSTSVVKYGAGSMAFNGSAYLASISATTDLYAFGSGDFTIEMWVYFNSVASVQCVYDSRPASTQGAYPLIYLNSDGTLRYFVSSADRITSSALSASTWYHVAVSRSGTSTRLFINGTQSGSTYTDSTSYLNASGRPWIGINALNSTQALNGYLDDLRVTKGVARYTANFTPPQVALQRQ